jgi:hypothetical protein
VPIGIITFTKALKWRIAKPPSGPPIIDEKRTKCGSSSTGHAIVLAITTARTRSGTCPATQRPIGPPQSCTTGVKSRRSRARTNAATTFAWLSGR